MPPDTQAHNRFPDRSGEDQLVDEMIFSFNLHAGNAVDAARHRSYNRSVEVALVAIVRFKDGKLAHEHIYWDQASVLKQIGLLQTPHSRSVAWNPRARCG
jgi:carboxymethylenebutenolidase